jgi:hypothetical protein
MPEKTYHVKGWRLLAGPALFAVLAVLMLGWGLFAEDADARAAGLVTGAILVAMGACLVLLARVPTLVVSDRGILLRQVGWTMATTWDNVERVDLRPGLEALHLHRAVTGRGTRALRLGQYLPGWYTEEQRQKVAEGIYLPLNAFDWSLRREGLQQEIERCLSAARAPR